MKKLVIVFAIFAISISLMHAQTEKGNYLIGVSSSLNFSSEKSEEKYDGKSIQTSSTLSTIAFSTDLGYFFIHNLAIGLSPSISYSHMNHETQTIIKAGPFVRLYFGNTNLKPFIGGQVGLLNNKYKDSSSSGNNSEQTSSYLGLNGGVAYFINKNISLNGILDYTKTVSTNPEDSKDKMINGKFSFSFGFGLHF